MHNTYIYIMCYLVDHAEINNCYSYTNTNAYEKNKNYLSIFLRMMKLFGKINNNRALQFVVFVDLLYICTIIGKKTIYHDPLD